MKLIIEKWPLDLVIGFGGHWWYQPRAFLEEQYDQNLTGAGSRENRIEQIAAFYMDHSPEERCYEGEHGGGCGVKGGDFYFLR